MFILICVHSLLLQTTYRLSLLTHVLADDIPNWPTLVIPSLACSVTSLFPSDTAFKILLAVATAFFVFDASVEAYVYSSAAVLTATTYNIAYMDFGESKMHRKVLNDLLLVI